MLPVVKGLLRLRGMILPLLWLWLQLLLWSLRWTIMSVWMWVAELTPVLLLLLLQMAHLRLMLMMAAVVRLTLVMLRVAVRMIVVNES